MKLNPLGILRNVLLKVAKIEETKVKIHKWLLNNLLLNEKSIKGRWEVKLGLIYTSTLYPFNYFFCFKIEIINFTALLQ